jgi:hypothetical protein
MIAWNTLSETQSPTFKCKVTSKQHGLLTTTRCRLEHQCERSFQEEDMVHLFNRVPVEKISNSIRIPV